jgi:hypothetical protein
MWLRSVLLGLVVLATAAFTIGANPRRRRQQ